MKPIWTLVLLGLTLLPSLNILIACWVNKQDLSTVWDSKVQGPDVLGRVLTVWVNRFANAGDAAFVAVDNTIERVKYLNLITGCSSAPTLIRSSKLFVML